jgi:thiosulfate/3-mercaptopyruvate sulfurtransferase
MPDPLIPTEELADILGRCDLHIVDASWHLGGRDARQEYHEGHIPGAVFFDIDEIADRSSDLPHMLPEPADFAAAVGALGIGDADQIVIYDSLGMFSAARVWWTFRIMGARNVRVLDGGLPKWQREGRPVTDVEPPTQPAHFQPAFQAHLVKSLAQVREQLERGSAQLVDARPAARFRGEAPEPRQGLRSGHMPGALNLPLAELVRDDGTFRSADELARLLARVGIDRTAPVTATCGSGITAAGIALALARLGREDIAIYDGAWAEWGRQDNMPVATSSTFRPE